jgi:hypothetical protein
LGRSATEQTALADLFGVPYAIRAVGCLTGSMIATSNYCDETHCKGVQLQTKKQVRAKLMMSAFVEIIIVITCL